MPTLSFKGTLAAGLIFALSAKGQLITTVAGTDFVFPSHPMPALQAPLGEGLVGPAVDARGNIYIGDPSNYRIMKISPDGTLTVVAGNGVAQLSLGVPTFAPSGDGGLATAASISSPSAVAVDAAGNLYIADYARIRKVAGGIITTVVGTGTAGFSGDEGPAIMAKISQPSGLAVDAAGNLYISDTYNNRIRKVSRGIITTVAGNGNSGFSGDQGSATHASLNSPAGIACDAAGNLYIADTFNYRIRKISGGIITTVAGNGQIGFSGDDSSAVDARLGLPSGVAVDAAGDLYIADQFNSRIRKVSHGIITTIAGNGSPGISGDGGPALDATLDVLGVAVDSSGVVYFTDDPGFGLGNGRVRKVTPQGTIDTVAGNSNFRFSGDRGPATLALLNWTTWPAGVAVGADGSLYIADTDNNRVRKVSGGMITTVAGNGTYGYSGDGESAIEASLETPTGLAVDSAGDLYIADALNSRVRKVSGGIITTVAGVGFPGYSGDAGPATSAQLYGPTGVAVDSAGNLFIAELGHRVRKVSGGIITTVAGTGEYGFSGDSGPAISAKLSARAVAVDSAGDIYIADFDNDRIRKVSGGIITTVAGGGTAQPGNGGPATAVKLFGPNGVAVDGAGSIYFSEYAGARIRKVTAGTITTVAGTGKAGFFGDGGLATDAMLAFPSGVTLDSTGNTYIADTGNNRVREVLVVPPQVEVSPKQLQFSGGSAGVMPPPQTISLNGAIAGLAFSVQDDPNATWLNVTPPRGASPGLIGVTADPTNLQPGTYSGTITIVTPYAAPTSTNVSVTFSVGPAQPPQLAVDKSNLSFPFPHNGSSRSQPITISNAGGGVLPFSVSSETATGGSWLSASPGSGEATPNTPASIAVTANPAGLQPGTYSGTLTISGGSSTLSIPVIMTISQLNQAILLSQTGLSFLGEANGGVILPQHFGVLNIGSDVVNWTVTISTLSGGKWLQVDTASGSTDAAADTVPRVGVTGSVAGLAPGKYWGQVRVDAPGAANTPQVLTAFLQVLPSGSATSAAVQPGELLFTATAGAESPGSQEILVSDISGLPTSFQVSLALDVPSFDLTVVPVDNTLDPQNPTHVVVQPFTNFLKPGVYNEAITFQFSDGTVSAVKVKIVVASAAGSGTSIAASSIDLKHASSAAPCQPKQLVTALSTLAQSFAVPAAAPVALEVDVTDDCKNPLGLSGSVVVSFSNGDPDVPLQWIKGGLWAGTWNTTAPLSQVDLTIQAKDPQRNLQGKSQISGALQALPSTNPPVFNLQGVVSAAQPQPFIPVAPGSIISIFGNLLAEENSSATSFPLPITLGETFVSMAGTPMPLYYASPTQVNALVPYGLDVNTTGQILVTRGQTYSQPVSVIVAPAQPAIFEDTSVAANQGVIFVVRGKGQFEAKPGSPATVGDVIVIYCAGLGDVNSRPTPSGSPAGSPPPTTTNKVQLTIGGQSAPVVFSGLVPGLVGLYQVNSSVPNGIPSGNAVPVTLSVAGQTSPPVTMAIQ